MPGLAQQDDSEPQHSLGYLAAPAHPQQFQPLREDGLARRFCDTAAQQDVPQSVFLITSKMCPSLDVTISLPEFFVPRSRQIAAAEVAGRWVQHAAGTAGPLQRVEHPMSPSDDLASVFAEQRCSHRPNPLGDMVVNDHTLLAQPLTAARMNQATPACGFRGWTGRFPKPAKRKSTW